MYLPKLPWRALPLPNPRETSERMNVNVIDKKQLIWKLFIYWYLMSFFINKMSQNVWATIMPFGPVTLIFYWPKIFFSGQPKAGPHFRHWLRYPCQHTCTHTWRSLSWLGTVNSIKSVLYKRLKCQPLHITGWAGLTLEKTERAIKNGQSRDTDNIRYTRHRTKTNKAHKHNIEN